MTSQLIAPENARMCSVSGVFALLLALVYPRFDLPCQISLRPVQSVAPAGRKADKSACALLVQEAQLMLTTGSTRLAVSRGQQTWYHSTCNI